MKWLPKFNYYWINTWILIEAAWAGYSLRAHHYFIMAINILSVVFFIFLAEIL